MAGRLLVPGWTRAIDSDGFPIAARISFFLTETDALAPVYADEGLTTPLTNPVPSNSAGRFPAVWAADEVSYDWSVEAPYGPPGSPFTGTGLTVALAAEILAAEAAEAAADAAEASATASAASAAASQAALAEIIEIAEDAPEAPSIANKANLDGANVASAGKGDDFRAAIDAADGDVFVTVDPTGPVLRRNSAGFGINTFPSAPLQVGNQTGISDPNIVSGRTISGAQAAYGHSFSEFSVINATLSTGTFEYAFNSYDARPTFLGSATYDHQAGYQNDPQFYGTVIVKDGWGYLSNGNSYDSASVQKYTHFLAGNITAAGSSAIGRQFGFRCSTLAGVSDQWAFYVDEVTNDSKFGRVGLGLNQADYSVHPSQGIDYNAPPSMPAAMVFRVDMTAYAFLGVARSAGDFGIATAVGDFIYRLQNKPFLLSTDGGVSVNFRVDATTGDTTITGKMRATGYQIGTGPQWLSGAGTPEGAVTASVGSLFTRTDGGALTTLYVKESGSGNTGWVAK